MNTPSMEPLFPLLLGPLRERLRLSSHTWVPEAAEDVPFLLGLARALDEDLNTGRLTPPLPQAWLELLVVQLRAPTLQGDRVTVPIDVTWPLPDQPWTVPEGADPREALIARLIHAGADPWAKASTHGDGAFLGDAPFAGLVQRGYPNLVRLALALPQARHQNLSLRCAQPATVLPRDVLLEALHHDERRTLAMLLSAGANHEQAMGAAQSAEAVALLLAHGHTPTPEDVKAWMNDQDATTARAMMEAVTSVMSSEARLLGALKGKAWGPVKDAMAACPEWKDLALPQTRDERPLRLPLHLLLNAQANDNASTVHHALRLMKSAPPDDREVAPGLTERALAGVMLRLLEQGMRSNTQADAALKQLLLETRRTFLGEDAKVEAQATRAVLVSNLLAGSALAHPMVQRCCAQAHRAVLFDGASALDHRTFEDWARVECAVRLLTQQAPSFVVQGVFEATFDAPFGKVRADGSNQDPKRSALRPTIEAFERLIDAHPERRDEVLGVAVTALTLLAWTKPGAGMMATDTAAPLADWVEGQLGRSTLTLEDDRPQRLRKVCTITEHEPATNALAQRIPALLDGRDLTLGTAHAGARRTHRRL